MNSKGEIYQALLDGETLVTVTGQIVRLVNGFLVNQKGDIEEQTFSIPENWKIQVKPAWYEKIPRGGVLCKYKNGASYDVVGIYGYEEGMYRFRKNSGGFDEIMIPLTRDEIQVFMDNVPEE